MGRGGWEKGGEGGGGLLGHLLLHLPQQPLATFHPTTQPPTAAPTSPPALGQPCSLQQITRWHTRGLQQALRQHWEDEQRGDLQQQEHSELQQVNGWLGAKGHNNNNIIWWEGGGFPLCCHRSYTVATRGRRWLLCLNKVQSRGTFSTKPLVRAIESWKMPIATASGPLMMTQGNIVYYIV